MQDYRKLLVWQKAHKLTLKAYELPAYLRAPEGWVLRDQLLGAAISIPSNIAEGMRTRVRFGLLPVLVVLERLLQ